MQQKMIGKRGNKDSDKYFTTLKYQLIVCVSLALVVAVFDWVKGYSVLLGGLVYLIPTALQARRHFSSKTETSAHVALAQMYAGQIWKIALTVILFALVFALINELSVFSLFATLILMQIIHFASQLSDKRIY